MRFSLFLQFDQLVYNKGSLTFSHEELKLANAYRGKGSINYDNNNKGELKKSGEKNGST